MTEQPTTDRRSVLRTAGAAALGLSTTGCLEAVPFGSASVSDDVVLDPPEEYDRLAESDLPYPIHGEPLPEVTVPAPLHDREVTTTEFVGDRHVALTFVFARCTMSCPLLTANLVQIQAESVAEAFADEFALLPTTFDPGHDTAAVLEEYRAKQGIDPDAGNWWFLRPESDDRAEAVVTDTFGVAFEYLEPDERETENMAYLHSNLIVLANADGYVERAYTGEPPTPAGLLEDVRTLRGRW